MTIGTFNFDRDGVAISDKDAYKLPNGDETIKIKFDNGFIILYTKTETGFKDMDFSHKLYKDSKGFYHADLTHVKKDFYDYFPN